MGGPGGPGGPGAAPVAAWPIDIPARVSYAGAMSHHQHQAGRGHPADAAAPSLLRMSVATRLLVAAAVAAVLWIATLWVIR